MWTTKWCNCTRGCYDNLDVIDFKDDNHDGNATLSELTSINNDDHSFFIDLKVKNNFLTNCVVELRIQLLYALRMVKEQFVTKYLKH